MQDVLSLPEVELMSVLDAGLPTTRAAVAHVSEAACPPCQTVPTPTSLRSASHATDLGSLGWVVDLRFRLCGWLPQAFALLEERVKLGGSGRLATTLCGLDEAMGGGIPMGKLTEVVGPSGIGKTQVTSLFR